MDLVRISLAAGLALTGAESALGQVLVTFGKDHDWQGYAVAESGDLNGDGVLDFVAGAPQNDDNGVNSGIAYALSGVDGSVLFTMEDGKQNDRFGRAVAGGADVNGDGYDDVAVGAPDDIGYGRVFVYSGLDGSVIHDFNKLYVGGDALALGDVNDDGFADVIVGAAGVGEVTVYSGLNGSVLVKKKTVESNNGLGFSVDYLGDIDGDGFGEFLAGQPYKDIGGIEDRGKAFVYSGLDGAVIHVVDGTLADEYFGWSVAAVGDVNADGTADFAVGTPYYPANGVESGRATVYSGLDASVLYSYDGQAPKEWLGFVVSAAGDMDRDGYDDFAVGVPSHDELKLNVGQVTVYSGFDGSVLMDVIGDEGQDKLGYSVRPAGDMNKDGFPDLLVGIPFEDQDNKGSVLVVAGRPPTGVYCEAQLSSQGCLPAMASSGTASLAASDFRANASEVPSGKSGLLFWGLAPKQVPFLGGSLCVAGPLVRTPVQVSGGNPGPTDCSGSFTFLWDSAYLGGAGLSAGAEVFSQYWYRDAGSASTTGLSDGLSFVITP